MTKTSAAAAVHSGASESISDESLRSFAGYSMKRTINVVKADLARVLEPYGLRMMTFTALILIVDNPDLSQTQLAGALAIERSNLVTIIDDLEKNGWIARNPAPNDRRTHALRATRAGRELLEKAFAAARAHEETLLAGLDDSEKSTLFSALRKIERSALGGAR